MAKLTLSDRIASAFVGAVVGAVIGSFVAWMVGVYSNSLGPSHISVSFGKVVLAVASFFALLGLIIGPKVGTVMGNTIAAVFEFESPRNQDVSTLLGVLVLAAVAIGVWWLLK
jgi:cytosine/uracil/thiamine/allantoin permease